jgi:hypothetical protein
MERLLDADLGIEAVFSAATISRPKPWQGRRSGQRGT